MTPSTTNLPPYGLLPGSGAEDRTKPTDWENSQHDFELWLDQSIQLIKKVLWPEWVPGTGWSGPATIMSDQLTTADLTLLVKMRSGNPVIDELPDSPLRDDGCETHKKFFEGEDQGETLGRVYRQYDRTFDPRLVETFREVLMSALRNKIPTRAIFYFKRRIQRPRPYQTAFILPAGKGFTHLAAKSALHPSMISGHAIQGIMGVAGMMDYIAQSKIPQSTHQLKSTHQLTAMEQYAVDIGDRRVFAGVHYPSDNLSSWILALDLCDRVRFETSASDIKTRVYRAIVERSAIYRAIVESGDPVYEPALAELHKRKP